MIRRPPRSTRTDTLFPYTTLFRSDSAGFGAGGRDRICIRRSVRVHHRAGCAQPESDVLVGRDYRLADRSARAASLHCCRAICRAGGRHVVAGLPWTSCVRSEERRVGNECVSTCSSWWSPDHLNKTILRILYWELV